MASTTKLPLIQRLSYGVGHVMNDLAASMWFSYLLIYFHKVISFNNAMAGGLMLMGQITDALCTPLVGLESDRSNGLWKIGKRKTWHLIGSICVLGSFAFVFNECITCAHAPDLARFIYYAPFVVIFQFGWASVQISHLSLIPDMTDDEHERVELNGLRYAFTVLSNLMVYGIFWLLFELHHVMGDTDQLSEKDAPRFQMLVFIILGIGVVFTTIFHLGTKEQPRDRSATQGSICSIEPTKYRVKMTWKCWLKEHQFYQVAGIYMCTRLVVNISQVYLPMYLTETLKNSKDSIAVFPLIVYVAGFFTSVIMRPINKLLGRNLTYIVGDFIVIGAAIWMYFIEPQTTKEVYGAAAMIGIGGTTVLVTSLAMTADLIAKNIESGAFVYGAMSFMDKLSNGIAIMLIQQFHPCVDCCPNCIWYYRSIMTFVPGGAAVLAFFLILTVLPQKLGTRRKKGEPRSRPVYDQERGVESPKRPLLSPVDTQNYGTVPINSFDNDWGNMPNGSLNSHSYSNHNGSVNSNSNWASLQGSINSQGGLDVSSVGSTQ